MSLYHTLLSTFYAFPLHLGSGKSCESPVEFRAQPQPKINFVYFSRKIWHLVTTMLLIFVRNHWRHLVEDVVGHEKKYSVLIFHTVVFRSRPNVSNLHALTCTLLEFYCGSTLLIFEYVLTLYFMAYLSLAQLWNQAFLASGIIIIILYYAKKGSTQIHYDTIRYDTMDYINVRPKADE